ncbi:winged helix-turn-helix DNA-binding domain protein [Vibrio phage 1.215.B._10N.222.54.F7]|nr:winged helix-turn-helix DNA-binding domain protein [Vibrio phage 1.215.A._10N.222.54.F7]AUR96112.1 winged helix-turn-helix DNA-binding domain protein [Vibrio phage 1.215.B._10N.222.54.F7]
MKTVNKTIISKIENTLSGSTLEEFSLNAYLHCSSATVGSDLNSTESKHLAFRLLHYIAGNKQRQIQLQQKDLAELMDVSAETIKKTIAGLRKRGIINTEATRHDLTIEGVKRTCKGTNTTSLVMPPKYWYMSNDLMTTKAATRELVRVRMYVIKTLVSCHPDLDFNPDFIATGILELNPEAEGVENGVEGVKTYPAKGKFLPCVGLKVTSLISINKYLISILKEFKRLRPEDQDVDLLLLEKEIEAGNLKAPAPKRKETNILNKKVELTVEYKSDTIDPEDKPQQTETEEMKVKHPKLAGSAKAPEAKTTTAELQSQLKTKGRVKPDYKKNRASKSGHVLEPTNKDNIAAACKILNSKLSPGALIPVQPKTVNSVIGFAKIIAETRNEKGANYAEALKLMAFAIKHYPVYMSFLNNGAQVAAHELNKVNLANIYGALSRDALMAFAAKEKAQYKAFDVVKWSEESQAPQTDAAPTYEREAVNPVGTPPTPPKRSKEKGAANASSNDLDGIVVTGAAAALLANKKG